MSESTAAQQSQERPEHCLNCGARLGGHYCATCGQPAVIRTLSVGELGRNLFEDLFEFDSRLWRTLRPLLFQPGLMTGDYLAGRRARYVAPLRLYIFLSVIFFVLAAVTGHRLNLVADQDELQQIAEQDLDPAIASRVEDAIRRRTDAAEGRIPDTSACQQIELTGNLRGIGHLRDRIVNACEKVSADSGASLESAAVDNISVMMVVFIPLLALIMKLLYPLSRRYYAEHLLFVVHYHAFGFLLLIILIGVQALGSAATWLATPTRWLIVAGMIYLAAYLYIALRRVYEQSHPVTAIKYVLLCAGYVVCLGLSLSGTIIYTALTL